ncbi:MAG TPA: penicillin acylase family protein, partial [Acidimicrobiales bacterium]
RTLRTRQNLRVLQRLAAQGDVTTATALERMLDGAGLSAELLLDETVARCRAAGTVEHDGSEVDVGAAAEVLAGWDGKSDLDAVGAALWREVTGAFSVNQLCDGPELWATPFDPDDPVQTPSGLADPPASGADPIVAAVARAVVALDAAGVALDAVLGDVQWVQRGEHRVGVPGGGDSEGLLNVMTPVGPLSSSTLEPQSALGAAVPGHTERTGLRHGGYRCTYGTSFVMSVELTDDGPQGIGFLAYGQSGDPDSEHHVDGTRMFAGGETRPLLFADADIEADPNLVRRTVRS